MTKDDYNHVTRTYIPEKSSSKRKGSKLLKSLLEESHAKKKKKKTHETKINNPHAKITRMQEPMYQNKLKKQISIN